MPPGQEGEGQSFAVAIADAQLHQRPHLQAAAAATQLRHQGGVAGPATRHQQFQNGWPAGQVLGHHSSCEAGECGEGVGGLQLLIPPFGSGR
jgi:hypothetical protein